MLPPAPSGSGHSAGEKMSRSACAWTARCGEHWLIFWTRAKNQLFQPMTTQRLSPRSEPATQARSLYSSPARAWTLLLLVFFAVHFVALFSPSLLDDADATHAQAAQHMAHTGDWVTLYVNGIRYLEKPPLPYRLAAI